MNVITSIELYNNFHRTLHFHAGLCDLDILSWSQKHWKSKIFSCNASKQWNSLSSDICHIQSSHAFKSVLKAHFCKQYHNNWFQVPSFFLLNGWDVCFADLKLSWQHSEWFWCLFWKPDSDALVFRCILCLAAFWKVMMLCFSVLKLRWCLATFWLVVMCVVQTCTWSSVWQHSDWLWCVLCRPALDPVFGNIVTGSSCDVCCADLHLIQYLATFWLVVMCVVQTLTWSSVWQHSDWFCCVCCRPQEDNCCTVGKHPGSARQARDSHQQRYQWVFFPQFTSQSCHSRGTPDYFVCPRWECFLGFFACRLSVCLVSYVGGIDGRRRRTPYQC